MPLQNRLAHRSFLAIVHRPQPHRLTVERAVHRYFFRKVGKIVMNGTGTVEHWIVAPHFVFPMKKYLCLSVS